MCKVLRLTPQLVAASDSVISDADDDATRYDSGTLLPLPTGTANNPTTADLGCGNPRVVTLLKRLDCVRIDALEGNIATLESERSVEELEIVVRQIELLEALLYATPMQYAALGGGNPCVVTLLEHLDCGRIDALEGNITTLEFERSVKDLEIVVRQIEWFERRDHHVPFRLDTRVIPSDLP